MVEWLWTHPQYIALFIGVSLTFALLSFGWMQAVEYRKRRRSRADAYRRIMNRNYATQANRLR